MGVEITEVVRTIVIAAVLVLLGRAARVAWGRRGLAVSVWRAIRPRHVIGAFGLMLVVLTVALTLLIFVPVTGFGLGTLVGLEGNAIFAPIDSALDAPAPTGAVGAGATPAGVPWLQLTGVTLFIGGLVALFPHLAHTEEVVFRTGWEDFPLSRQIAGALRFGLLHMIMLIPLAAALAVGVAGFAYGRIYRRAYRRAAVPRRVIPDWSPRVAEDAEGFTRLVMGPPSPVMLVDRAAARKRAVFEATVWHTTFNTTVAVIVWLGYIATLVLGP